MPNDPDQNESSAAVQAPPAPPVRPEGKPSTKPGPVDVLPPWRVLLHNDDHNDMGFVVETICMLTPLNQTTAVQTTLTAHTRGLALLVTTHKERAELYQDQFQSRGLTVTIEPAQK
ncbi:MAG: ATP-dependent Clp protease adaptor protein ClpS [Phycisphaerales bacterium]|jgi:ATP-dependent Clp protease adaptor protein ClpS